MRIFLFLLLIISFSTNAQTNGEVMSLQACIDYALQHNNSIKQSQLQVENGQNLLNESRIKRNPNVNGFTNFNGYNGRSINPYTNGITTNITGANTFGLQSSITLFDGFQTRNNIAYNALNMEASKFDLQAARNQTSLNVVLAYLNILSQQDLLEIAQRQLEVTKTQLDKSEKLVRAGSAAETILYDIKAQIANDELSIVNTQNNLQLAQLNLKQLMNITANRNIQVIRTDVPNPDLIAYANSSQEVYETAQGFLPEIQAADLRIKVAQKQIDIAKGFKLPTVSANASLNSSYTTAAKQSAGFDPIATITQRFGTVNFNGADIPLDVKTPVQLFDNIPYFNQLSGNFNSNAGLTVRVPIFNAYNAKFRMAAAEIQTKNAELQADNARITLRQNIEQAYINMSNAAKRYSATQNQVTSLEQAFHAAEIKFNVGSLNALDYSISKTNLDKAKANLIQTKYDYIFRTKILDYYQNKPLSF